MVNKLEAMIQLLAAMAIIYFGQQLLRQANQKLRS